MAADFERTSRVTVNLISTSLAAGCPEAAVATLRGVLLQVFEQGAQSSRAAQALVPRSSGNEPEMADA